MRTDNTTIALPCMQSHDVMLDLVELTAYVNEILTSLWSKKLYYKFVESTEDGDFMLAFDAEKLIRTFT